MRTLLLLLVVLVSVDAACNLCGRGCNRGMCSSASDGCTECGRDCGLYGCGGWYCRAPATFGELLAKCTSECKGLDGCYRRCKQVLTEEREERERVEREEGAREEGERNATLVLTQEKVTGCNICNLDCSGIGDPWCADTASGSIVCGTCVYVSDYGGSGYLCQRV